MRLPAIGEQFGEYFVEDRIGAGGMGSVYRARQRQLERPVALKVMLPDAANGDPEAAPRFLREARVAASLTHPGIVAIYDVGTVEDTPYIAMEWVEGRTLLALLRSGELSREEKLELLREIAEILVHAHASGVVHRDLKPANVIIDRHGKPKLLDFGIAKRFVRANTFETRDDVILGTPAYMPPEAGFSTKVDASFDQYAWGVIAFELLTGKRPSPDARDEDPVIEAILARATATDPTARFPSIAALLTEWRTATAPRTPAPAPTPPPAPERSRGALLFAASAASVVLVAGIAFAVFLRLEPKKPTTPPSATIPVASTAPPPEPDPPMPSTTASASAATPPARAALPKGFAIVKRVRRGVVGWTPIGTGASRNMDPVFDRVEKAVATCAIGKVVPPRSRMDVNFEVIPDGNIYPTVVSPWLSSGDYDAMNRPLDPIAKCIIAELKLARAEEAIGTTPLRADMSFTLSD